MTSKSLALTQKDHIPGKRPLPLMSVWSWEVRRVFAKPLNWGFGLASFLFFIGMMWFKHAWTLGTDTGVSFVLYGTSAIGLLYEFTVVLMLVFAFMLPFVVTEGVARDYKKRMHEVLMTTALPTPAYVWGRFLAVLSLALGQAVLMLLAGLAMGSILHLRNPVYPQPSLSDLVTVWALIVVPSTILIAGVGFSLGTLWPRRSRIIELGILIAWILLFTVGDVVKTTNPTGISVAGKLISQIIQSANTNLASLPAGQRVMWAQQIQAHLPNLRAWLPPQYSLAFAGILCVAASAVAFRRFRLELD